MLAYAQSPNRLQSNTYLCWMRRIVTLDLALRRRRGVDLMIALPTIHVRNCVGNNQAVRLRCSRNNSDPVNGHSHSLFFCFRAVQKKQVSELNWTTVFVFQSSMGRTKRKAFYFHGPLVQRRANPNKESTKMFGPCSFMLQQFSACGSFHLRKGWVLNGGNALWITNWNIAMKFEATGLSMLIDGFPITQEIQQKLK